MFRSFRLFLLTAGLLVSAPGVAQLLPRDLVDEAGNVDAPLGVINKSLQEQIGAGHGDVFTPNSAVFIIKRDPARAVRRGRQLFQRKFSMAEGVGPRINFESTGDIAEMDETGAFNQLGLGAGLADSCALCHGRPRGSAGHGGNVVTRPDSRDAPQLFGLGLVEQLADEMTAELRAIRTQAINQAKGGLSCSVIGQNTWGDNTYQVDVRVVNNGSTTTNGWSVKLNYNQPANIFNYWDTVITNGNTATVTASNASYNGNISPGGNRQFGVQGKYSGAFKAPTCTVSSGSGSPVTLDLTAKGVAFGRITAFPDGTVDTSKVDGVDPDLRIKPFFHHGETISIREFTVGAFEGEMGLQTFDPILCAATDPVNPQTVVSPSGFVFNPALDEFERPPLCENPFEDGDEDGVVNEIDPAIIDHVEFYLLNYFRGGQHRVTPRAAQGRQLMTSIGCTGCHVPNLTINTDRRVADVETEFDSVRGIFNNLFATATPLFHSVNDGTGFPPLLLPNNDSFVVENFFSDLKRHDLGPFFHERQYDGSLIKEFVTEPLVGVGTTAPYGHDGRSINLDEVIRRHGGEALQSRQAYEALGLDSQLMIQEFLETLVLFPPDDTASNLNPGNPGTNNPQVPAEHGFIDLSQLFVLPLGPE